MIPCFTGTYLEKEFSDRTKGMSDDDARAVGKEIIAREHEKAYKDFNKIKSDLGQNTKKYTPLDFASKEQKIRDDYDEKIRETKAETPKPSEGVPPKTPEPPKNVVIGDQPSDQSGTRISKEGIFEQYGAKFEHTPVGWNEKTQKALGQITDDAIERGVTVAARSEAIVNEMAKEALKDRLTASPERIVAATVHLMNMDDEIARLDSQTPKTVEEKQALGIEMANAVDKHSLAVMMLDKLGSLSGTNLGFFSTVFNKMADGGISVFQRIIGALNKGLDVPDSEAKLDASDMSQKDKDKVRPYVKKIEAIKTEYDDAMKKAKESQKAESPKSAAARKAKSEKAVNKLLDLAKQVRASDFFDKYNLAKPIKGATQGFTFDIQENLAKALEHIAAGIKKGEELIDLIKEAASKFKGNNDEADFHGLINHVLKQNQELDSFKFGRIDVGADALAASRAWQQRRTLGQLKALAQQAKENNLPWYKLTNDYRRSFLIGGLKTLGRVGESGIAKLIIDPLTNLTTGNIVSKLPGLGKQSVSIANAAAGFESLIKFKNDQAALDYVNQKQDAFEAASKNLEKDISNPDYQDAYKKTELDYAQAAIYRYMHGNDWSDSIQIAKTGSTDFEEAMGGYVKIDPTLLRGQQKVLYVVSSLARLHGVEKNPSARRAMIESYNNHISNFQQEGVPLSASTRMRAMDMAYEDGFMPGKYQNKTQLSEVVNRLKFATDKPNANLVEKAWTMFAGAALPVAKVPINIVKTGVDMSTLGIEGIIRYAANINRNYYDLSKTSKLREAQGLEYNSIWQNLLDGAKDIPAKDRAYIHNVLKKGLFGLGMYAYSAWAVNNGTIQYGGEYDDSHKGTARRRYKKSDGTWSEPGDLEYGQWVINGHKFGKFASSVINHVPEFLPMAMYVNTHNVYTYEHEYEGVTGDRATKGKLGSGWEATKSDINELSERLPFSNILNPSDFLMGLASVPLAADISQYFDKDKDGNYIERKPTNVAEKLEMKAGLRFLVPKKDQDGK